MSFGRTVPNGGGIIRQYFDESIAIRLDFTCKMHWKSKIKNNNSFIFGWMNMTVTSEHEHWMHLRWVMFCIFIWNGITFHCYTYSLLIAIRLWSGVCNSVNYCILDMDCAVRMEFGLCRLEIINNLSNDTFWNGIEGQNNTIITGYSAPLYRI